MQQHKLSDSHQLVQFWNKEQGHKEEEFVPSVIGCSILRPNAGLSYMIFALAHFKPFGALCPLIPEGETFETIFKKYSLPTATQTTITNWDAINECEDAHDAERMRKAAQMMKESQALTNSLFLHDSSMPIIDDSINSSCFSKTDFAIST